MPARRDHSQSHQPKDKEDRAAGGSYGDRQSQYGTAAPGWKEPLPGHDDRGDFGAGGEAFGSSSGQGRYEDAAKRHPAWQPFAQSGERLDGHPPSDLDLQYRAWGRRAMEQHDGDYRAYRAEQDERLAREFEDWRAARRSRPEPDPES